MRRYIRHPASIPIEITNSDPVPERVVCRTHNVGECGLAFRSNRAFTPGTSIRMRIPIVQPPFETSARVAWCRDRANGFELGVEFSDADEAFRTRMFEQICHIENYRNEIRARQGRELTPDQAADEWISKFASEFPRTN